MLVHALMKKINRIKNMQSVHIKLQGLEVLSSYYCGRKLTFQSYEWIVFAKVAQIHTSRS